MNGAPADQSKMKDNLSLLRSNNHDNMNDTEVVNENAEAEEKAAKAKRDIALPTLNRVIDAMENLNDIYEEQEDLLAKQEKASEKVAKSQNREKALTSQRDFALKKLIEAAKNFGSPLYVYDASKIKFQYKRLTSAFKNVKNLHLNYAVKALSNISILNQK